jgi:hypothetical protein
MTMNTLMKISTTSAALLFFISCNKPSFRGTKHATNPNIKEINIVGIDDQLQGEPKTLNSVDSLNLKISATGPRTNQSTTVNKKPMDLYFVVDSTASMSDELLEIKNGLKNIVDGLSQGGIELNVGFIGFIDSENSINQRFLKMTSNINQVRTFLNNLSSTANIDYPEGSLLGIQKAILRLQQGDGRPNSAKVIMFITDVVGHNGGPENISNTATRDCSISKTVNMINNYKNSLGTNADFRFYYSVPNSNNLPANASQGDRTNANFQCSRAPNDGRKFNIKEQMQELMGAILPNANSNAKGGELRSTSGQPAWPLKQNTFVSTLVTELNKIKQKTEDYACAATALEATIGSRPVYTWTSQSFSEVINDTDNTLEFSKFINPKAALGQNQLTIKINRCCVKREIGNNTAPSSNGGSPQCLESFVQTVNYQLKVN